MGANNYDVTCIKCSLISSADIYWPEGWTGLKVDSSEAVCEECEMKANPQDWFDHQCCVCGKWFHVIGKNIGTILDTGMPVCWVCVRKAAEKVILSK